MAYNITLPLPEGWESSVEVYEDEVDGTEITHLEAHLFNEESGLDDANFDIYLGDMPPGADAEEVAVSNYADLVGWDDEDDDEESPVTVRKFNGKKAWGFDVYCDDDSPMTVICTEFKQGVLAVISAAAKDEEFLQHVIHMIEAKFRLGK